MIVLVGVGVMIRRDGKVLPISEEAEAPAILETRCPFQIRCFSVCHLLKAVRAITLLHFDASMRPPELGV